DWLVRLELAAWGDDDLIEYLVATNRAQCGWVMSRVRADDNRDCLRGSPQLWRIVLDEMIVDETLPDPAAALRKYLATHLPSQAPRLAVARACRLALREEPQSMNF